MEIAIFGGSFNPPTKAHESIMAVCLDDARFDEVWVMPSADRTDKPNQLDKDLRLRMLDLVKSECFQNNPRLVITDFELQLPGSSCTSRTYKALCKTFPDHNFHYVFGADSFQDMPNWRGHKYLQRELSLLIIDRPGYKLPAEESERLRYLNLNRGADKPITVSSTVVRAAVAADETITNYVCHSVEQFIGEHGLYAA